jgi:hypothetical protein
VRLRREAREGATHTRPLYRTNRCPVLWSLELLLLDAQSDSNACVEEAQGLEVARQGPYGHVLWSLEAAFLTKAYLTWATSEGVPIQEQTNEIASL